MKSTQMYPCPKEKTLLLSVCVCFSWIGMLDPLESNVMAYDDKYMENVYRMKMCNAFPWKKDTKTQCTPPHLRYTHTHTTVQNEEAAQLFQLGFA